MTDYQPLDKDRPVLPSWLKWAYGSIVERDFWKFSISRAANAWNQIERLAVVDGHRIAARITVPMSSYNDTVRWATSHELVVLPYATEAAPAGYGSLIVPGLDAQTCLLVKPENVATASAVIRVMVSPTSSQAQKDDAMGTILGYPKCCREFYARTWGSGQVDSTWDQFATTGLANGPVECNMLWRFIGIRWVPHLPCSYQCAGTTSSGAMYQEVAQKYGFIEEAKTINQVLRWPVSVSSVNGILEIEGPCLKLCTNTDWAPPSHNRWYKRDGIYVKPTKDGWEQNGMRSYKDMVESHDHVIRVCKEFVPPHANVIDLGCGNGALLRRLKLHLPNITIGGIDLSEDAIVYANKQGVGRWVAGNYTDVELWKPLLSNSAVNVVITSPNRIMEIPESDRKPLLDELANIRTNIVISYSDMIRRASLPEWCESVGLPIDKLLMVVFDNKLTSVGVIRR